MITKGNINDIVEKFITFRKNMNCTLTLSKARYIWGRKSVEMLEPGVKESLRKHSREKNEDVAQQKIRIAKERLKRVVVFNWVQFVGISGSIAAGFTKEEDDIDLFIVVKDGCAWIYRGILTLRNIFNHTNRTKRDGENVKDLFCINYIVEERGLEINADMFNMHELMYLIPLYNSPYLNYIYKENPWLVERFGVNRNLLVTKVRRSEKVGWVVRAINFFAYIAQVMFMYVAGHRPELKRLQEGYRRGRIVFYPKEFKERVLKELNGV